MHRHTNIPSTTRPLILGALALVMTGLLLLGMLPLSWMVDSVG